MACSRASSKEDLTEDGKANRARIDFALHKSLWPPHPVVNCLEKQFSYRIPATLQRFTHAANALERSVDASQVLHGLREPEDTSRQRYLLEEGCALSVCGLLQVHDLDSNGAHLVELAVVPVG